MPNTYSITEAQQQFTQLCRGKKPFVIRKHDKAVFIALPMADWEALTETLELLANPKACKTLLDAKAGKLKYKELDLDDENFGL